jgi:hypothetical protein
MDYNSKLIINCKYVSWKNIYAYALAKIQL